MFNSFSHDNNSFISQPIHHSQLNQFLIQNSDPSSCYNYRNCNENESTNWKRMTMLKVIEKSKKLRAERNDTILYSKTKFIHSWKEDNIIGSENDLNIINDLVNSICNKQGRFNEIENDLLWLTSNKCSEYWISFCPICNNIVFPLNGRVVCLNQCFKFNIEISIFTQDFRMDNLMDMLMKVWREHQECNSGVQVFYSSYNTVGLECQKCFDSVMGLLSEKEERKNEIK